MNNVLDFRTFLELVEKTPNYFDTLKDMFGIKPEDIQKVPRIASFASFGKNTYNLTPYKILGYEYDSQGKPKFAKVELMDDPAQVNKKLYQKQGDKQVRMPAGSGAATKTYLIPIDKLQDVMTKGLSQPQQPDMGGGGAPLGIPPGGMV